MIFLYDVINNEVNGSCRCVPAQQLLGSHVNCRHLPSTLRRPEAGSRGPGHVCRPAARERQSQSYCSGRRLSRRLLTGYQGSVPLQRLATAVTITYVIKHDKTICRHILADVLCQVTEQDGPQNLVLHSDRLVYPNIINMLHLLRKG